MAATASSASTATNAFSTSTSSFRASQSQFTAPTTFSYADSSLTQLPHVDFNFEDLRKRMADFTVKFDAFIEKGRKRVLEERNDFRGRLGELGEEQRSTTAQIQTLESTTSSHRHLLDREKIEKNEMHAQIADLEARQSSQMSTKERLRSDIAHTQRQIDAKLAAQREYAARVDSQTRLNGPELNFWESYLGCRIEGAGTDNMVRVVFCFPPTTKGGAGGEEREAVFELKVPESGGGGYEVVFTKPKLESAKIEPVVSKLNQSRNIATILKGMRELFATEVN